MLSLREWSLYLYNYSSNFLVNILIPYLYAIKDGNSITDKANLSLILGLFVSKAVTLEKAAELVEKPIWDFIDLLKSCQIL